MPTRRPRNIQDSEFLHRAEEDELARARKRLGRSGRSSGGESRRSSGAGAGGDAITAAATFFVGSCVCTFLFFENPFLQPFETYRLVNAVALLWIPYMAVMFAMRQDIQQFGMTRGDQRTGYRYAGIALLAMLPLLIIASLQPNFRSYYGSMISQPLAFVGYAVNEHALPHVRPAGLLYYECIQGFYMFCWEFFFRGFLLFGLARARFIGPFGAVLLQAIPFALLHFSLVPSASKPPLEIASAFFGGLALGWLAVKTRTFYYGFLVHWGVSAVLDLLLIGSLLVQAK